jgi:hypothetical protein
MTSSGNTDTMGQPNPAGSFVENTVIIQEGTNQNPTAYEKNL